METEYRGTRPKTFEKRCYTGSLGEGCRKPLSFWVVSVSVFCKLASQTSNMTDPILPPPPQKLTGFASISGTTSGKIGVGDMSTPVHPVAMPLALVALLLRQKLSIS